MYTIPIRHSITGAILEMIGLEPLDEPEDLDLVKGLLERHTEYTGSTVSSSLLDGWPAKASEFVKVMPTEYRRVLDEQAAAKQESTVSNG